MPLFAAELISCCRLPAQHSKAASTICCGQVYCEVVHLSITPSSVLPEIAAYPAVYPLEKGVGSLYETTVLLVPHPQV